METREIKFRIIYKNTVNGYERLIQKDGSIHWEWMCLELNPDNGFERWSRGVYPHDYEYIRNQFTGLKDKNGVEIYEGDILKKLYGSSDPHFVVRWHQERLMFIQQDRGLYNDPLYQAPMNYCEVIGNIYETPHLLNL